MYGRISADDFLEVVLAVTATVGVLRMEAPDNSRVRRSIGI